MNSSTNKYFILCFVGVLLLTQACGDINIGSGGGDFTLPVVETGAIKNLGPDFVSIEGELTNDGGAAMEEMGFVWATSSMPNINDNLIKVSVPELGDFEATIQNLSPETQYYIRAFATNEVGTAYGDQISYTTEKADQDNLPQVETNSAEDVTQSTAVLFGNVSFNGPSPIQQKGFVWDTDQAPTVDLSTKSENGTSEGSYSHEVSGLIPNSTYYFRAYARNENGIAYGNQLSFTTKDEPSSAPTVSTIEILNITDQSAEATGNVMSNGGEMIIERGIVWSESPDVNLQNGEKIKSGQGIGTFTVSIDGLIPETNYYLKAYASNEIGVGYGEEKMFKTSRSSSVSTPIVMTASIQGITSEGAITGGTVTSDEGAQVTARGVVWSLNANPVIEDGNFTTDGTGLGSFVSVISGLLPETTYYVRAYAENSEGVGYGSQEIFKTKAE